MKHLHIFCIAGLLFNSIHGEASKHKRIVLAVIVHKSNALEPLAELKQEWHFVF